MDRLENEDIGVIWARHFPKRANSDTSNSLCLTLAMILRYPSSHELFVFLSPLLVFLFPFPFCRSIRTPALKWHYFDRKGLKDDNRFARDGVSPHPILVSDGVMIWPPKWLQTFGPGMRLVSGEIHVLDALSLSQVSINKVCLIIIEGAQSFVHQARIGEIDNKSPQPFYGVFVNRDGTNLARDYCYKPPKRLNTRLRVWASSDRSAASIISLLKKNIPR